MVISRPGSLGWLTLPSSRELQVAFEVEEYAERSEALVKLEAHLLKINTMLRKDSEDKFFDNLADEIHPVNVDKGFWGEPEFMDKIAAKLALVHSEVSEILEALRKGQGSGKVTEEFADVFIRSIDVYGVLVELEMADPNLFAVMQKKMKVNAERPHKHGHIWG